MLKTKTKKPVKEEPAVKAEKPEVPKVEAKVKLKTFKIEEKIAKIKSSSLPASQKCEMISKLLERDGISKKHVSRVSFAVYATKKTLGIAFVRE